MLQYNTKQSDLRMPEYGRHVQQMVDHCLTLESRQERNSCARAIIDTICRLFPQQRTNPEWRAKLWDHLAIMSDFKLDIDYPAEPVSPDDLTARPAKVPLPGHNVVSRVYGGNIMQMIEAAKKMPPDSPDTREFILLLANHMKKLLVAENPDIATDRRIFADLASLSGGNILLNPDETRLRDFELLETPGAPRKKRRKR